MTGGFARFARGTALATVSLSSVALATSRASLDDESATLDRAHDAPLASAGERPSNAALIELGERNCFACHAATDALVALAKPAVAPDLARVGARVAPSYLERFLANPHDTKPGTRMPAMGLSADDARALARFLATLGGPFDAASSAVYPDTIENGRQLFHEVGCVQCHGPLEHPDDLTWRWWELEEDPSRSSGPPASVDDERRNVPLGDLSAKTNAVELARFLLDPLAVRPSGRMPSLNLTEAEARDIASYLLRGQMGDGADEFVGLAYDYYEADFPDAVADWASLSPVKRGSALSLGGLPESRADHFGFRFRGFVRIDREGEYTFFTTSDDGSMLYVDGELIVDNRGHHPMVEESGAIRLGVGRHAIEVTQFEQAGGEGLVVHWQGPGFEKRVLEGDALSHRATSLQPPLASASTNAASTNDAGLARRGRELFVERGCHACHTTGVEAIDSAAASAAPDFARVVASGASGAACAGPPDFALAGGALAAELGRFGGPLAAPSSAERITLELERFRCNVCHSRDGEGGAVDARLPYFYVLGGHDLGDEGRVPPQLDEPGSKLRPAWIQRVMFEGASARPYMATRMPQFGQANVGELPALFLEVDGRAEDVSEPEFSMEAVAAGRALVGTYGLGCINCHDLGEHPSLGIPAVDLAEMHERLQPDWFRRLLLDPIALNMNTRMPEFWVDGKSPVKDLYDGDPARQIDAMWTYLSLGDGMPLPDGLVVGDAEYELGATRRPTIAGVFMKGVSPRTVVVGFPELTHYAFDVQNSRLAKTWRGRFFNLRGTWEGRAGVLESPPSSDVLDLPTGPAFALLDDPADVERAWPTDEDGTLRARGRRLDAEGRPSFVYALGDVTIEEKPVPELTAGGSLMRRSFRLFAPRAVDGLYFRGPTGTRAVEWVPAGDGVFVAEFEEVVSW